MTKFAPIYQTEKKIAAKTATDILVTAGISNSGGYVLAQGVANVLRIPEAQPNAILEKQLLEAWNAAGCFDGMTGRTDMFVDGLPMEHHASLIEELNATYDIPIGFSPS